MPDEPPGLLSPIWDGGSLGLCFPLLRPQVDPEQQCIGIAREINSATEIELWKQMDRIYTRNYPFTGKSQNLIQTMHLAAILELDNRRQTIAAAPNLQAARQRKTPSAISVTDFDQIQDSPLRDSTALLFRLAQDQLAGILNIGPIQNLSFFFSRVSLPMCIWHIEATSPAVEIQLKLAAAASWRLNGKMLKPTSTYYYLALDPTFSVLCSTYEDEKVVSRKLTLSVKSLVLAHRIHRHGSGVGRHSTSAIPAIYSAPTDLVPMPVEPLQ
ncbi:hypothetical protein B0H14DRAFT_2645023 [Mycena olivaceomarginata]|nr:hypothetical protein B0H14DRAFT_2645023 [Mycena olivaceomarginata]